MLTEAQRHEYLLSIERLPMALESALRGLNDEQLEEVVEPRQWSLRQLVHHMADVHYHGYASMKAVLAEERPSLNGRVAESWATMPDTELPISVSMWILRGVHGRWIRLLRSQPPTAWSRPALDRDGTEIVLDDLLKTYAERGREALEQIAGLRARRGW
ncbi:MAG: DinB family protein [Acidobacteriota bacterium]|jgi:hypothetical protein